MPVEIFSDKGKTAVALANNIKLCIAAHAYKQTVISDHGES